MLLYPIYNKLHHKQVPIPLRSLLVDSSIPKQMKLSTLTAFGTLLDHLPSVVRLLFETRYNEDLFDHYITLSLSLI